MTIIYIAAVDIAVAVIDVAAVDIAAAGFGRVGICGLGHDALSKIPVVSRNDREVCSANREVYKICSGQSRREAGLSSSYYDNPHPIISCQDNTNTSEVLTNYCDLTPPPQGALENTGRLCAVQPYRALFMAWPLDETVRDIMKSPPSQFIFNEREYQ